MPKSSVKKILEWYTVNKRSLPWRKENISAYEVWISEIMLQQTQVARVIIFYQRFLKKFPTIEKLAKADWEDFLPYYEGLGYYNRGRNMLKTAKIVRDKYGGKFPHEKIALMQLPGIGEYTASAIRSFAFGEPEIAFDTNFRKIFGTHKKAEAAFRKSGVSSAVFNSAVMDYANAHKTKKTKIIKTRKTQVSVTVVLHENHKKYFSESAKTYKPFMMPASIKTRKEIKKYFLEKYNLRLSVRPPNEKGIVNAQILVGAHRFSVFSVKPKILTHK